MSHKLAAGLLALLLCLTMILPDAVLAAGAGQEEPQEPPVTGSLDDAESSSPAEPDTGGDSETPEEAVPGGEEEDPGEGPGSAEEDPSEPPDGQEQETPPGDGSSETDPGEEPQDPAAVTVTFMDGDEVLSEVEIPAGSPVTVIPETDAEGNPVLGWVCDRKKVNPAEAELTEDTVFTVWDAPSIADSHGPYVSGVGDGKFAPENPLTRAEAAALVCNILEDSTPGTLDASFPDVTADHWYYAPVMTLTSLGVISGRSDGTYMPDSLVSRAEFVSLVCSMYPLEKEPSVAFPDTPEDRWFSAAVNTAASRGWVGGTGDGLFHPDGTISRAEAVTLLNSVMDRSATEETAQVLKNTASAPFLDVHPDDWYYASVLEAFIPHTAEKNGRGEEHWLDFGYVSSGFEPGLQRIDDAFYLVDSNGQFLFYPAGIQTIGGKTYLFAEDGSIPGPGPQDTGDALYCVNEDGSLLMDGTFGYLYFGADGRYTSGDPQIDAEVEKALANCITPGMNREEKLRAAYCYVRDNCLYLGTAKHYPRGYTTEWYVPGAINMFTLGKGNCYAYSGAFLFLARRLGWQAYGVSAGYRADNTDHAWVMIDGYIYDPCLEYLYPVRSHKYYDLYRVDPNNSPLIYWFP